MDSVVQQNAAQTAELSSTAQSLAQQAQELQGLVAQFRLSDQTPITSSFPATPQQANGQVPPRGRGFLKPHLQKSAQERDAGHPGREPVPNGMDNGAASGGARSVAALKKGGVDEF